MCVTSGKVKSIANGFNIENVMWSCEIFVSHNNVQILYLSWA